MSKQTLLFYTYIKYFKMIIINIIYIYSKHTYSSSTKKVYFLCKNDIFMIEVQIVTESLMMILEV